MRHFLIALLSLAFTQTAFGQAMTLDNLASGVEQMVHDHKSELTKPDRRAVRRNLRAVRQIFADYGIQPDPNQGGSSGGGSISSPSKIYQCTNSADPVLMRYIVDSEGKIVRQTALQTFTAGGDDEEKADCQAQLYNSELGGNMMGECRCSNTSDPILSIDLVNSDYQTVRTININTFTIGGDDQEERDCQRMVAELDVCTGL